MHADANARGPGGRLNAGKHVQVEIPLADSLRDAQEIGDLQKRSGLVAM